jgi:hypothetical protein
VSVSCTKQEALDELAHPAWERWHSQGRFHAKTTRATVEEADELRGSIIQRASEVSVAATVTVRAPDGGVSTTEIS